ncbi:hypothetical protein POM88_047730 [Heracleum sosnowskyi]|uniref:NAD-dependent epimerase/dehydratase domain-containing protein n=1 Tax=Heracleum sosnowskyi TaxID=360622 RepID=A0AAD8GU19_9APIA|nr:hypothetical protein POM88_047730 [Heracleum sosnowskyi]
MESKDIAEKTVCVTGASGFIGSWLVRLLLDRGYTVHATVKNLHDENETKHLQVLEQHESHRLRLFQIDLLDYESIVKATPCIIDEVVDPEKEILGPAIRGTKYVLMAAKELGVRRVVITSSNAAIIPNQNWPADSSDPFSLQLLIQAYDENETKHLQVLEEHESHRLRLFQIDLPDYVSIVRAITGVFHLATPFIIDEVVDPEKEILGPAIGGTKYVLMAAKELGVQRVVITSSNAAIIPNQNWPADSSDPFSLQLLIQACH